MFTWSNAILPVSRFTFMRLYETGLKIKKPSPGIFSGPSPIFRWMILTLLFHVTCLTNWMTYPLNIYVIMAGLMKKRNKFSGKKSNNRIFACYLSLKVVSLPIWKSCWLIARNRSYIKKNWFIHQFRTLPIMKPGFGNLTDRVGIILIFRHGLLLKPSKYKKNAKLNP